MTDPRLPASLVLLLCGCPSEDERVEEGANSIECSCRCTLVNVDGPFGIDTMTATRDAVVCVPPESRGELEDFQGWCDSICFAAEQALDANYGCGSTCEVAKAADRARWWSACDDLVCDPAWCEDCHALLHEEGTAAWKECITTCNGVEEDFEQEGEYARCGQAFGPYCAPGPEAPSPPGSCATSAGTAWGALAGLLVLRRRRPGR
jgi:MYXO-CTERM domain-containing protein